MARLPFWKFTHSSTRIKIASVLSKEPLLQVKVSNVTHQPYDRKDEIIKATCNAMLQTIKDIIKINPLYREQIEFYQLSAKTIDEGTFCVAARSCFFCCRMIHVFVYSSLVG